MACFGIITGMSHPQLSRQVPVIISSWSVQLRPGAKVGDEAMAEVVPLVFRLEHASYTEARPPWPAEVTDDLALTRWVRAAIRNVQRVSATEATITLESAPSAHR